MNVTHAAQSTIKWWSTRGETPCILNEEDTIHFSQITVSRIVFEKFNHIGYKY